MLVGLGAVLLALALFVDWPPNADPSLPNTQAFLLLLGGVIGIAGLLIGFRREQ
jgi:hypothetical protein